MPPAWSIILAVLSATIAFIYARVQSGLERRRKRRSLSIAIYVEISEASKSIENLFIAWDELIDIANQTGRHPLLVLSRDTNVLQRINIEDLDYPASLVAAIMRFSGSVSELYECLETMNSDKFERSSPEARVRVVEMARSISVHTSQYAKEAMQRMKTTLPEGWTI
ncbi:hypothetical protein [Actibacterium lipolyticum]|uniref:Uncharacterized protein n=1 Tax=Actibacterium lipolyticum TaxID=1524263 RepID=A0A238JX45_9RHOB|nr:hypothetical protein [Actibacterium lipolyticum]SMX35220.1 hypothetical protein COL8621_01709 [Actibacterium lipolyticum]